MGRSLWMFRMVLIALLVFPVAGVAVEKGHEGMHAMKAESHGGMMKMGDKVWGGKVGPWRGEARLMDMKAHMEKAKASGMKMEGTMKSHHLAFELTDTKTKKPVTQGKGKVMILGPDKKVETADFHAMEGHFGADVNLPNPGIYTFNVKIESGGKKGLATFSHTVK